MNPVECLQKDSLVSCHPVDWRIGPSKQLMWTFKNRLYPKFPDARILHWSYEDHMACNNALDQDWIEVRVAGRHDMICLSKSGREIYDLKTTLGNLEPNYKSERLGGTEDNKSRSISISNPSSLKTWAASKLRERSALPSPNRTRRYLEVSTQVIRWTKGSRDQAVVEANTSGNDKTKISSFCSTIAAQGESVGSSRSETTKSRDLASFVAPLDKDERQPAQIAQGEYAAYEEVGKPSTTFNKVSASQLPPISSDRTMCGAVEDVDRMESHRGVPSKEETQDPKPFLAKHYFPGSSRQNPIDLTDDGEGGNKQPQQRKKCKRASSEYCFPLVILERGSSCLK